MWLFNLFVIFVFLLCSLPYIVCGVLRLLLWRVSFKITVLGFLTYSDILLNVPVHLNFNLLIRIKLLKIRISAKNKPISVQMDGLDLVFVAVNEFDEWQEKKLQLLHMLEKIKAILVRKGIFEPDKDREATFEDMKQDDSSNLPNDVKSEESKAQDIPLDGKKGFLVKLLLKFIYSLDVKICKGTMRFLLLKGENLNISSANINDLFSDKIDNAEFLQNYECFSVNSEEVCIDISPSTNNEIIVNLTSNQITHINSIFEDVTLIIRIPLDPKLTKNLCNWCIGIECRRGLVNMSIEQLLKAIRFFMILDTMLNVINRTK